jgi:hypothetical protein
MATNLNEKRYKPEAPKDPQSKPQLSSIKGIKPVMVEALGKCPICRKVILSGWQSCSFCGWKVKMDEIHPFPPN